VSTAPNTALLDAAPGCCVVFDDRGRFTYVNEAAAALLARPREELIGTVAWDAFPDAVKSAFFEQFERMNEAGHVTFEEYLEPLNLWLEVDARATSDGIVVWFHDTSKVRRAEEATRLILEQLPTIVWTTDTELSFTSVGGGGLAELTPTSRARLHERIGDLVEGSHPATAAHRHALDGSSATYEFDHDGQFFEAHVHPKRDSKGNIVGTIGVAVDVSERRNAEQALYESERLHRSIVETAAEGIWLIDGNERTTFVNPRLCEVLGYQPHELMGRSPFDFFDDDFADVGAQSLERIRQGVSEQLDFRFRRKDGSPVDTWVSATSLVSETGAFTGALVMVTDARERVEQEQRFRAVFDAAADAMILADDDRRTVDVNAAACELFEATREELLQKRGEDLFAGGDTALTAAWNELLQTGHQRGEFTITRANGELRHISSAASANVLPGLHVSILRDVTERKRAEDRYRNLVERLPVTMYVKDAQTRAVTYISPQVIQLLGYNPAEWQEPNFWKEVIHPADRERVLRAVDVAHASDADFADEFRVVTTDGRVVWIVDATVPVRDESGRVLYLQGFLRDVTEHKALEEQLRQSQKMETVGRLAGGMAHDFNNLLTAIVGYAQLAAGRLSPDDGARRDIEEVTRAADRAADLIRQLLAFSRRQVLEAKVLDVNDAVRDLERMLGGMIGEHIELVTALDDGLRRVKADPSQLQQVILNLAVNARDAMPGGGRLTIATRNVRIDRRHARRHAVPAPGWYVELMVTDTGEGMDAAVLDQIFEPFFTTKPPGEGTGLGLATVHGIVNQSGGEISVESEPGAGTTFRIFLPATTERPQPAVAPAPPPAPTAPGAGTILLLEDEKVVRDLVRAILERDGFRVIEASVPEEALAASLRDRDGIDLLLTDVVMPGMSGPDVARAIGSPERPLKVLYMSGYSDEAVIQKGLLEPGSAFLQKPFSAHELTEAIRALLKGDRLKPEPLAVVDVESTPAS
jgi:two-component system, cell cycle sensor histidine kinase and response regulator CckA